MIVKRIGQLAFAFAGAVSLLLAILWIAGADVSRPSDTPAATQYIVNFPFIAYGFDLPLLYPPANSHTATQTSLISAHYPHIVDPATVTSRTFSVQAMQSGRVDGLYNVNEGLISFTPDTPLRAGQWIQASAATGILYSDGGRPTRPTVWQFRVGARRSAAVFRDSGQRLDEELIISVHLGDVDGDGDLDVFAGRKHPYLQTQSFLWLNDGDGRFAATDQQIGYGYIRDAAFGDLDGDHDLDLFIISGADPGSQVWLNDGLSEFSDSGQQLQHVSGRSVSIGDVDGDGDLDVLVVGAWNFLWLNDGAGYFTLSPDFEVDDYGRDGALGDLDGDSDLDLFLTHGVYGDTPDQVWLNDGRGHFTDSGQSLGSDAQEQVTFGDADGDGDLDVWSAGSNGLVLWLNDGQARFSDGGQFAFSPANGLEPADLDGDGDLDALLRFSLNEQTQLWLNDGQGHFTDSGRQLAWAERTALGDVDSDGDIDAWLSDPSGSQVWLNENLFLTKHGPEFALTGAPITYTLTVTNLDTISHTNVVVSDTLPAGAFYLSGATLTGNVAHWHISQLAAGETVTMQLVVTTTQVITNTDYRVTADGGFLGIGFDPVVTALTPLTVTATSPAGNGQLLTATTPISATFNRAIIASTVTSQTFLLHGQQTGLQPAVYVVNDNVAQLVSGATFEPGETIMAILSRAIQPTDNGPLIPFSWQFRADVTATAEAAFYNSRQPLGEGFTVDVALADLNGDSALDAVLTNINEYGNVVLLNKGNGELGYGQHLGHTNSRGVALGDLDNDGDLDIYIANWPVEECYHYYCDWVRGYDDVWLNNGEGGFSHSGQQIGAETDGAEAVALGDLDGDGDLDVFLAAADCDKVWFNDGAGQLTASEQVICTEGIFIDVTLGDLDGDGDLDAFLTQGASIWFNDGSGHFTFAQLSVDFDTIHAVEFGDLDGDGDLDAVLSGNAANYRLQNDGSGTLTLIQTFGTATGDLALGDLDGDGDLDAFFTHLGNTYLWLNDGTGYLIQGGETSANELGIAVDLGDTDGDGDLDALVGTIGANHLWLNAVAADLTIHKAQVVNDSTITYTLAFTNYGPKVAQNVVITDLLPAALDNVTFSSSRPITATTGVTYSWQVGDLALNDSGRITVTGTIITWSNTIYNQVVITAATFDPFPADNLAQVSYNDLVVVTTLPPHNSWELPPSRPISITFNRPISEATVNTQSMMVRGRQHGVYSGLYATADNNVYFTPDTPFYPGEEIAVLLRPDIHSTTGDFLITYTWQFRAAVTAGVAAFLDSGQQFGESAGLAVALGDLDGDGDLDAFVGTDGQGNEVWLNDGAGGFTDTGQRLGSAISSDVALGDLDGDGDLDVYVATGRLYAAQPDEIWFNNGNGFFTDSGQYIANAWTDGIALGDLDSDGDLDAYIGNDGFNEIWFNDGNGLLTDSQQRIGGLMGIWSQTWHIALGDLDGDGDLDAFEANHGPSLVMLNDGHGFFSSTGQNLGTLQTEDSGAALGDADGDGDLDVILASSGANRVWFNDGQGYFMPSEQPLGNANSFVVALGDLDQDGDLDALAGNAAEPQGAYAELWINDGAGIFTDYPSPPILSNTRGLALGDLDGDGSLDAFLANWLNQPDWVWFNPSVPTSVSVTSLSPQPSAGASLLVAVLLASILLLLAWHRYRTQSASPAR
jgi:uncharacterized repeat protein (TIGR01451 family)